MQGPLEGLRIIDASNLEAGAICSVVLADHGADVTLIEPRRGTCFSHEPTRKSWQRGKAALALDFDRPGDLAEIRALAAGADVFMTGLRPAQAARLGLDHASLAAVNPGIIVCHITAYGEDTPWADRPFGAALAAARLGVMAEQMGPHRDGPIFLGHPALTYGLGFVAAIDILAGLRARRETGLGQAMEASLLDSFLAQTPMLWWWNERGISFVKRDGGKSQGYGNTRIIATMVFECADGKFVQIHSGGPGGFKRSMDLLGFGDRIQTIAGAEMAVPLTEDETHAARVEIFDAFKQKPRDEWIRLFQEADIAILPVLYPGEALLDEQVAFAGQRIALADADYGTIYQAAQAIRFDHAPAIQPDPAKPVGTDNGRVEELIARTASIDGSGKALSHPLEGIRVLDFSSFFATGYGARILSDLGAEVTKVEAIDGEQMRPLPDPFEACQRGKKDLAIDFKSPEGLEAIHRLVAEADVVMHNLRPGKAEKAGIGYKQLSAINPRMIYAYLPGYGSTGPKSQLKSFAPLVSGWSGLMFAAAGQGNPPVTAVYGNEDYNNGFLAAIGVLMGVEQRHRTGKGTYLECPQINSSLLASSEHFLDANMRPVEGVSLDAQQTGFSALERIYRTGDGWLCIDCRTDEGFAALARAIERDDLTGDLRFATPAARTAANGILGDLLAPIFLQWSSRDAFDRLDAAGAPCEIAREEPFVLDFLQQPWTRDTMRTFEQQTIYGRVLEVGHFTRLKGTPSARRGPAPLLGEHSAEVLASIGYDEDRIADFARRGIIRLQG
jgi:crotonobetainyl-CoA:carnitine CoA-transferase CaiB-like acyl-CoA transferase